MVRALMEKAIGRLTRGGNRPFFDPLDFPWVAGMEADWKAIRRELDDLLKEQSAIPNFQDLSEDQKILTEGTQWKTFFFWAYGHPAEINCARCPETTRALGRIPGMKTAFFSILAPGKHIPEHRGPYKGVLRYHLALLVPSPMDCGITVGGQTRRWEEGKSLVFDDSLAHTAWNGSASHRVILFCRFSPASLVSLVPAEPHHGLARVENSVRHRSGFQNPKIGAQCGSGLSLIHFSSRKAGPVCAE